MDFFRSAGETVAVTELCHLEGNWHIVLCVFQIVQRLRLKERNTAHFLLIYATDMKYLLYISFGMYFDSKPMIPADNELHIYFETVQTNINWKHVLQV